MKRKTFNSLSLNKKSIASLKESVKGGVVPVHESDCSSFGNKICWSECLCQQQQL